MKDRTRFPWLMVLLAIPALAILLALGTWQVQRLAWKEDLLATIAARLAETPEPLAKVVSDLREGRVSADQLEYKPATARVGFLHDKEQFFFATHRGRSGYYVYTPGVLPEFANAVVFFNRGFVPFDRKDPASRPESRPRGLVTVEGLLRVPLFAKPSFVVPDNDPAGNTWYWKDLAGMTAAAGLPQDSVLPVFLDAGFPGRDYPAEILPVPGVTLIDLPNNHLQYAVTWYGLALTLIGVVGVYVRRRMTTGHA